MKLISIPPFLTMCACMWMAVFAWRRCRNLRHCRLLSWICALAAVMYGDMLMMFNVPSARWALIIHRVDRLVTLPLMPLYIQFFHDYLGVERRRWLVAAVAAVAAGLMLAAPTPLLIAGAQRYPFGYFGRGGPIYPVMAATAMFTVVYALVLLLRAMGAETMAVRRHRLAYLAAGFGTAGLLTGLDVLPALGVNVVPPGSFGFIPLGVFFVGLCRHDLLDMGLILNRGLVYSLVSAGMTLVYAGLVTAANARLVPDAGIPSPGAHLMMFLAAALVIGPMKHVIQSGVDRVFHQSRMAHRRIIREVSRMVTAFHRIDDIGAHLTRAVADGLNLTHCRLFAVGADGGACARLVASAGGGGPHAVPAVAVTAGLEAEWRRNRGPVTRSGRPMDVLGERESEMAPFMGRLDAAVLLPLFYQDRLNGFIVIGEKRSGAIFGADDVRALDTLANQTALAVENAAAYSRLQSLNRGLEKKVDERTRALREALHEKERTQEQLVRSESLAAIGELVAGVAHELNNPLASVKSLLQSVVEDLSSPDPDGSDREILMDDLAFADKELTRAAGIVSALLGLARRTDSFSEAVDVNTVITDALRVLYNRYKNRTLRIETALSSDIPLIQGNFAQLGQVMMNIIHNALQAVDEGGRIRLRTEVDKDRGQVVCTCADDGPGIPESIRGDIFKPFFTTKPVGQGTGLGLYICHSHVVRHGGTITVASAGNGGTCMTVRLPVDR